LDRLKLLDGILGSLEKGLYTSIIGPILHPEDLEGRNTVLVEDESIRVSLQKSEKSDILKTFDDLTSILTYLQQRLPASITQPLSAKIIPTISSALISSWLSSSIPISLADVDSFRATLDRLFLFSQTIEGFGWSGTKELTSWAGQIPRLWLTKRRVNSLDEVRKALSASSGTTKKVERVEKEKVSSKDEVFADDHANDDDWDAWASDEEKTNPGATGGNPEEDDVSAWGFDDDDAEEKDTNTDQGPAEDINDAADAWGWGDEDDDGVGAANAPKATGESAKPVNGDSRTSSTQREVTLKELYTVTEIPDSIAAIILRQVSDSKELSGSEYVNSVPFYSHPLLT
jgi:centromere/kinetochore protein ZW10